MHAAVHVHVTHGDSAVLLTYRMLKGKVKGIDGLAKKNKRKKKNIT